MTDQELVKIIQKTIKDEIRPLKEYIEIVKSKISKLDLFQNVATEDTRKIKEQQSVINEKLDALEDVKEILEDRVYPSVVEIENTIKAYGDMYKINNENSKKLEKRLEVAEDKLNIQPDPEFSLVDVS